jgi:hypothetical protein
VGHKDPVSILKIFKKSYLDVQTMPTLIPNSPFHTPAGNWQVRQTLPPLVLLLEANALTKNGRFRELLQKI